MKQGMKNQEEADTKLIFHACVVLKRHPYKNIIIRNTSGDVDIIVIALGVIFKSLNKKYFLIPTRAIIENCLSFQK